MMLCLLAVATTASAQAPKTAPANPRDELLQITRSLPMGRARMGIHVVDLAENRVLFSQDAEAGYIPASNMKLITAAAALHVLGADFKYVTRLGWIGENLVVIASGDPATGDARILAADPTLDDSIYGVFDAWAKKLVDSGKGRVRGDLIVDDTIFDREFSHPSWSSQRHSAWYVAQVGGANFNDNCLDLYAIPAAQTGDPAALRIVPQTDYIRVINRLRTGRRQHGIPDRIIVHRVAGTNTIRVSGSCSRATTKPQNCTIHNPPGFFAMVLAERLRKVDFPVVGKIKLARVRTAGGEVPDTFKQVASHGTPLAVVLKRMCKHSQNLFAEAVLKTIGAYHKPPDGAKVGTGSWKSGRAAVGDYLATIGIAKDACVYDDGGGLSKLNRFSPKQICTVLAAVWKAPYRQSYLDSLAIAGTDGTLSKRMKDGPAAGRVFAKTGYVSGASALSGYVHTRGGKWLAFSFLFNKVVSNRDAKKIMNRLCERLAKL